ncbi:MAG: hypothetical protein M3T56_15300 [Chloroflexota bacterium]|nr:hypothetical protein [Chloroflexota bacterium]
MPDEPAEFDPTAILRVLDAHEVKFVVVGGVSGNLHGSTTLTEDIDIAYARDRQNLERLAAALRDLRATLRGAPKLPFKLDAATLRAGLNFTFSTRLGPLDCIGEAAGGFTYDNIVGNAEAYPLAGMVIAAASLDDLIRMKRAAGRIKDRIEVENLSALREVRDKKRR